MRTRRPLGTVCRLLPVAAALGCAGVAVAQDDDAPDLDFLEYLGSWQEGDDEWVVVAGIEDGFAGAPVLGDAASEGSETRRERRAREAAAAAAEAAAPEKAEEAEAGDETDED